MCEVCSTSPISPAITKALDMEQEQHETSHGNPQSHQKQFSGPGSTRLLLLLLLLLQSSISSSSSRSHGDATCLQRMGSSDQVADDLGCCSNACTCEGVLKHLVPGEAAVANRQEGSRHCPSNGSVSLVMFPVTTSVQVSSASESNWTLTWPKRCLQHNERDRIDLLYNAGCLPSPASLHKPSSKSIPLQRTHQLPLLHNRIV